MRAALLIATLVVLAPVASAQTRPDRAEDAIRLAYRLPGRTLDTMAPRREVPPDSLRPPDAWLGPDKALHAGGSFLITLSAQYALTDKAGLTNTEALPVSAAVALALGLAKEVHDGRRAVGPHFSLRDLAADALGVALAALATRL